MLTPIGQLVAAAGEDATITVFAADTSTDYDPASSTSFAPGAATAATVSVVPSKLFDEMLHRGMSAHFLAETIPAGTVAGSSVLTHRGTPYTVMRVRMRVFVGVQDGWSLECKV